MLDNLILFVSVVQLHPEEQLEQPQVHCWPVVTLWEQSQLQPQVHPAPQLHTLALVAGAGACIRTSPTITPSRIKPAP